jgi:predicted O-methyltransferase YrrM
VRLKANDAWAEYMVKKFQSSVADLDSFLYISKACIHDNEQLTGFIEHAAAFGIPPANVNSMEGKLLEFLVRVSGARRIIEFGTLFGYSAICMARGAMDDAKIFTVEHNPLHLEMAVNNIRKANLEDKITVIQGEAEDLLADLTQRGPYDFCFIDADWLGYPLYVSWAIDNVRCGGIIAIHNVFFFGTINHNENDLKNLLMDADSMESSLCDYIERSIADKSQLIAAHRQIRIAVDLIISDPRCESVVLPFTDGLLISHKVDPARCQK